MELEARRPRNERRNSREAAQDRSPRRKPWVRSGKRTSPKGAKERLLPMTLFVCAVFTLACLYYVFFFPGEVYAGEEKTRLGYLRERKEAVYENLRDLNFEYKAGKVPDADYQSMRNSLEEEAAAIMAEIARLEQIAGQVV
jgi:hypothetical protein